MHSSIFFDSVVGLSHVWIDPKDTYWYVEIGGDRWQIVHTAKLDEAIERMIEVRAWRDNNAKDEFRLRNCKTGETIPGDAIV